MEASLEPLEEGQEAPEPKEVVHTKWIYERWNKIVTSDTFPNIAKSMGDLLIRSSEEVTSQKEKIREAKEVVIRAAEEKKAQLAAAAAKKAKATKKGGKKEDQPADDEDKNQASKTLQSEDGDLNLNDPEDFAKALSREVPRPFTFGPIEFNELNLTDEQKVFDADEQKQRIIDSLDLHM